MITFGVSRSKFSVLMLCILSLLSSLSLTQARPRLQPPFVIDKKIGSYTDHDYRFSVRYPVQWQATVPINTPHPADPSIIGRRLTLQPADEPLTQIRVDVWDNSKQLLLQQWFDDYERPLHPADAIIQDASKIKIAGVPGLLIYESAQQAAHGRMTAVVAFKHVVIRVDYYTNDGGFYQQDFLDVVRSLQFTGHGSAQSKLPNGPLINTNNATIQVQSCCGWTDPNPNAYPCSGGNCTWWAKYKRPDVSNYWGNARDWRNRARQDGFSVGYTPRVGAIAVWQPNVAMGSGWTSGGLGHVAYVTAVESGGWFVTSNMNWGGNCSQNNGVFTVRGQQIGNENLVFIYAPNQPPRTPNLIAPAHGSTVSGRSVTLQWQDTGDPDSGPKNPLDFFVEVKNVNNQIVATRAWAPGTSWNIALGEGTYTWHVKSGDGVSESNWSSEWRVTITCDALPIGEGSSRKQAFIDAFNRGGGRTPFGCTINGAHWWGDGERAIVVQDLRGGAAGDTAIIHDEKRDTPANSTPAYVLHGGIWNYYLNLGGWQSWLGPPTSDHFENATGQAQNNFRNGYIAWNGGNPQAVAWPAPASGHWRAEYHNGPNLNNYPTWIQNEGDLNHNWGTGAPGSGKWGVWSNNFSARWTGRFNFNSGKHTFIATTDDGMRVWLDGNLIIDQWRVQATSEYRVDVDVSAGEHDIKVEYFENDGGALAQLRWEPTTHANTFRDAGVWNSYSGTDDDQFYVADFDGDGKDDLVFSTTNVNGPTGSLSWYWMKSDGSRYVDKGQIKDAYGIMGDQFYVADFDGDGKDDIVIATSRVNGPGQGLTWYWLRSTGTQFEDRGIIAQAYGIAGDQFYVADFDGDGKDDLVTATSRVNGPDQGLTWYWMRSTGTLIQPQGVIAQAYGTTGDQFYVADFDGDGKDDLMMSTSRVNGPGQGLTWYWLRSTGTLIQPQGVIAQAYGMIDDQFYVADFDGDGKDDLVTATSRVNGPDQGLTWYWMRSTGTLIQPQGVIAQAYGMIGDGFYASDFNGDGKGDIVTSMTRYTQSRRGLTWFWMRSNGSVIEDGGRVKTTYGIEGDRIYPADVDGDGQGDLIIVTSRIHGPGGEFTWFWMKGTNNGFVDMGQTVYAYGLPGDQIYVADVDGDGKDDVLVSTTRVNGPGQGLTWYWMRSTGTGFENRGQIKDAYAITGDQFYVADFDGDGKDDVLVSTTRVNGPGQGLTWYWMRSTGTHFEDRGIIAQAYGITGDQFYVADFDGDGKDDIVTATSRVNGPGQALTWYWMRSTGAVIEDRGIIAQTWGGVVDHYFSGDFNGDGKDDIVRATASTNSDNTFRWEVAGGDATNQLARIPNTLWADGNGKPGDTIFVQNYRKADRVIRTTADIAMMREMDGAFQAWMMFADFQ